MIKDTLENLPFLKQAEVRVAKIALRLDGIMQIEIKDLEDINVNDLEEIVDMAGKLGEGKSFPNLIYINHFLNANAEVRAYAASEDSNKYTLADAFVVKYIAVKLIGNFYISFNKPVKPTRIFTSDEGAIEWLKSFL